MFRERIRKIQPDLSPGFTRVAEFCLDRYTEAAFLNVSEFAKAVDVDPASIVRFAQRLGYPGYPELQDDIREEVKKQLHSIQQDMPTANKPAALFDAALKQMERNLEAMQTTLDPDAFKQFVAAIRRAPRVHIVASEPMRGQGEILVAALMNIGKASFYVDTDLINLAAAVLHMGKNDVVIALEIEAALSALDKLLPLARGRGALTAVLVGPEVLLAVHQADWVFHTPNRSALQSSSHVSAAAFISGLYQVLLQPTEGEATERYQTALDALLPENVGPGKPHTIA